MMNSQLWQEAAEGVEEALQPELKKITAYACGPDGLLTYVNYTRDECRAKQWTCKNIHGERVYIRDVLGKVAFWLDKIKSVGDVVASFDPVHAALPWAGVRFLIVIATSDIAKHGAIMESVEIVASVISRYTLMEQLYCQRCVTNAERGIRKTVIALYSAVLAFLCKASVYFTKSSVERFFASLKQLDKDSSILHQDIIQKDLEVKNYTLVVDKEILDDSSAHLGLVSESMDKMKSILIEMQRPMATMAASLSEINDGLKKEERMKILNWISTEKSHHKTIASRRLADTGTWLLKQRSYEMWKYSTRTPFLWLNGGPGTGKSILTSLVIDDIMIETRKRNGPPLAYFYCSRDSSEPRRGDSTEVLLSILRQLLSNGHEYSGDESLILSLSHWQLPLKMDATNRLDQSESIAIITDICSIRGAYIIIDALDECSAKHRENLMDSLDIICKNTTSIVNIFISSRPNDYDIKTHFTEIPRVEISAKLNSHDIKNFVVSELENKIATRKFLGGNPPQKLVDEVKNTLIERADGVFRWVAAVIETLCASGNEYDVRDALEDLPSELAEVYDIIMKQIYNRQKTTGALAKKMLYWLLCAQQQLHTGEVAQVLSIDQELAFTGGTISTEEILDWCCNLVKYDEEQRVIRFTHLSVREYLEKHPDFHKSKANEIVALACLKGCEPKSKPRRKAPVGGVENKTFYDYAMVYWPLHCANAGELRKTGRLSRALMAFLYEDRNAARTFRHFLDNWEDSWFTLGLEAIAAAESRQHQNLGKHVETESVSGLQLKLDDSGNRQYSPIFLACAFGFTELLEDETKFQKLDATKENNKGHDPFSIAVRQGQESVLDLLTMKNYGSEDSGEGPLIAAVSMNRGPMVEKLLAGNPDLEISGPVIEQALYGSSYSVVKYILGSERCEYFEPNNLHLQMAAQNIINGDEIIDDLLARNRRLHIEDETFEIACRNTEFGIPIIKSLLQRNSSFVATEISFQNAAANQNIAIELLELLSETQAAIKVTIGMIDFAAMNKSVKPIEFLLRQDPQFRVSCSSLSIACRNPDSGDQILPLLLERSDMKLVDHRVLRFAMDNHKVGVRLVKNLLAGTTRQNLPITTDILLDATMYRNGEQLLDILLLECVGMQIHPAVLASATTNYYSPIEMVQKLCERDPPVEVTEEACINAVLNSQYAMELVDYLIPLSKGIFKTPVILKEMLFNDRYGYELAQRFWTSEEKPAVTEQIVEAAVLNEAADKILDHWYSADLNIPITRKAIEFAFTSPKAVEVFASLLKFDRKLQIDQRALCAAASNSTKGPVLIKRIFRHLGRNKCIANDQVFFAAAQNPESGGEVIKFLFNNFKYPKALTPALMECVSGLEYEPTTWTPLLENAKAAASITTDALEYALRAAPHVVTMLSAIFDANPKVQLSTIAWENLFGSQRSADTMINTFDTLAKYRKIPECSERVLSALMKRWRSSQLYSTFQEKIQELDQSVPITVEVLHACIYLWTEKTKSFLEAMFRILDEDSKKLELTNELYKEVLINDEVEGLLSIFEDAGYTIPVAVLDLKYMQYALVNEKLKDATLEKLFHITPEERKSFCRTEEGLMAMIELELSPQQTRKALARMERPLPITTKVLVKAFKGRSSSNSEWLRIAADENPREFPSLITDDLFVMVAQDWGRLHELYDLSLEIGFNLSITPQVLGATICCAYDSFRLLACYVITQQGPDKLFTLLTEECMDNLPKLSSWEKVINNILKVYISPDKVETLYSEAMLLQAAGQGSVDFIDWMHDKITDCKPKEYYLKIIELYEAAWSVNLLKLRELLDTDIDPNVKNPTGSTFLATACEWGELSTVRLAMKYPKVDINIKNRKGMTPLMVAANQGNYGIVEELLTRCPEKHHRDICNNRTAEEDARWCGYYGIADMIRDSK